MLSISALQVIYQNGTEALKSVTLRAEKGESVAIIGHSEAGKIDLCYFADNDIFKQRTAQEFADLYASNKDGQIVPIAFSAPIPGTPFAVNHALPDRFRSTLKNILTTGLQNNAAWITANGYWYVDPSAQMGLKNLDEYYNSLRDVAKILGLDLKQVVK